MNYTESKKEQAKREEALKAAEAKLRKYPSGPMGLTPQAVRDLPQWQADRQAVATAFNAYQKINRFIVANFKREQKEARMALHQLRVAAHPATLAR